jgi:hypothetical protein
MRLVTRTSIATAGAIAAVGIMAVGASASTVPNYRHHWPVTATTRIVNRDDSGNNGNWAKDRFTRTVTVRGGYSVASSNCGLTTGSCYAYTATLWDAGSFRTISGAFTPNQVVAGLQLKSVVEGSMRGSAQFATFYATAKPKADLVPRFLSGDADSTSTWPELFFPSGTTFAGLTIAPWSWSYHAFTRCGYQHWTDASSNGSGNLAGDGNIVGCTFRHRH